VELNSWFSWCHLLKVLIHKLQRKIDLNEDHETDQGQTLRMRESEIQETARDQITVHVKPTGTDQDVMRRTDPEEQSAATEGDEGGTDKSPLMIRTTAPKNK
jgi:hypothetical protein